MWDPLVEAHHALDDLYRKYKKEGSFDAAQVSAILDGTVTRHPLAIPEPFPADQIDDCLREAVSSIIRLQGTEMDDSCINLLVRCAESKLSTMAAQMCLSQGRRRESRPTAFKSGLQHVLHLNRIQDPLELQTFYHSNVVKRVRQKMELWKGILGGVVPDFSKEEVPVKEDIEEDSSGVENFSDEEEDISKEKSLKRKHETIDLTDDLDDSAAEPAPKQKRARISFKRAKAAGSEAGDEEKKKGIATDAAEEQKPVETSKKTVKKTPRGRKVDPKTETGGEAEIKSGSTADVPETPKKASRGRKKANADAETPRGRPSKK